MDGCGAVEVGKISRQSGFDIQVFWQKTRVARSLVLIVNDVIKLCSVGCRAADSRHASSQWTCTKPLHD